MKADSHIIICITKTHAQYLPTTAKLTCEVFKYRLQKKSVYADILTTTPKSGEVELQMAPILAAASMASTASAQFGM